MTDIVEAARLESKKGVGGIGFDWVMALLSLWLIGGLHLDAWAHHTVEVESFFTPWHGVLYSGFLVLALAVVAATLINVRQGDNRRTAIPTGYRLSLLGVVLFMAGGMADGIWHTLFGIEENIEALLSPTHLLLALGIGLMVSGPLRAAWKRTGSSPKLAELLPALISLALLLALFSFFTAYANPFAETIVGPTTVRDNALRLFYLQGLGIASVLLYGVLLTGVALLAVRRWALPLGSFTVMLPLSLLLTTAVHAEFRLLIPAFLAGAAADLLNVWLKPTTSGVRPFRLFAVALPTILYALYFATLELTGGIWWSINLWAGAIFLAGIVGWLLSFAFLPPAE